MNNQFKIKDLDFFYKESKFNLQIDDLCLKKGELTCILGANGCGKSTFLKLCSGGFKSFKGEISLNCRSINDFSALELARNLSFLPQDYNDGSSYRCEDIVMMGRYPHQSRGFFPSSKDKLVVETALKKAGVDKFKKRLFSTLSGGEKKRVLIASVLSQESNFLLLDEPTSSLDIKGQWEIFSILNTIKKENKGIIVSTHNINLASIYADKIILFSNGKIIAKGCPDKVLNMDNLNRIYGDKIEIINHPDDPKRKIVLPLISMEDF